MRTAILSTFVLSLSLAGCSLFHRDKPAPVVEAVRTPDLPTPPTPIAPPAAARDLADVMGTELQLTPAQIGRVRTILNGTLTEANTAKAKHPPKSAALNAELQRINVGSQKELRLVLGLAKFKELQTKQRKIAAQMQQRQK